MNKQIQVLYTIFKLELPPPFNLVRTESVYEHYHIYNKHSEIIGWYYNKQFKLYLETQFLILDRVKQVFNSDKLSNEDVYNITKHLFNWLQDNFPEKVETVLLFNVVNGKYIDYTNL